MTLKTILDKYEDYTFNKEETLQLVFLYTFLEKEYRLAEFENILNDYLSLETINDKILQEIIKCITHNIPYKPLLKVKKSENQVECMIELRRFLEDTNCDDISSPFLSIANEIPNYIDDKNIIYEFRRFNKSKTPITYNEDLELFSFIKEGIEWMVLASMYEVYSKEGFCKMMEFARKYEKKSLDENKKRNWTIPLQIQMYKDACDIY